MRLLIYEYCCATGLGRSPIDPAHSLFVEGQAMRNALASDFAAVPDIQVELLDGSNSTDEPGEFLEAVSQVDACLVIAPEFDQLLADRCQTVLWMGKQCWNCSVDSILLCGDKLRLAKHWQSHEIRTPETRLAGPLPQHLPCVWKPRYGAGSTATRLLRSVADAQDYVQRYADEPLAQERIEQELVPGLPASISFLVGRDQCVPLAACRQLLSDEGSFLYQGGELPLSADLEQRAIELGRRAISCVSGLAGYVGVDLILGQDRDGDTAIEINPRLTTSYLGLRELYHENLAELLLRVFRGESPGRLTRKTSQVRFSSSGT